MNTNEWIDKYYSNELTAEELKQFEDLRATDAVLSEEFEFQENLRKSIKSREKDILKSKLQRHEDARKKSRISNWKIWAVAASILVVISVAGIGYFNLSSPNYDNLYAQNYEAYPNTEFNISRSEDTITPEYSAFVAYERENYSEAIDLFLKLKNKAHLEYVDFYLAQTYMANGDFEKAIKGFDRVIQNNSSFVDEASWYAALAALKLEKQAVTKKHLNFLVGKKGYKASQAQAILEILD